MPVPASTPTCSSHGRAPKPPLHRTGSPTCRSSARSGRSTARSGCGGGGRRGARRAACPEAAARTAGPRSAFRDIRIEVEPPSGPVVVEADASRIQQVLLNLLFNATEAMPAGGAIRISLQLDDGPDAPRARLDIIDTGGGVPETLRGRIFDSFLSGRPDGTGLGLAIAKRILASHRGDIELAGTSAAGTTMRVTLPLAK